MPAFCFNYVAGFRIYGLIKTFLGKLSDNEIKCEKCEWPVLDSVN